MSGPEAEDFVRRLEEEFRRIRVSDFLAQAVVTLSQLGWQRLEGRDLGQARLAIEAIAALVPVLEGELPEGAVRDLRASLASLQLAYARQAEAPGAPAEEEKLPGDDPPEEPIGES